MGLVVQKFGGSSVATAEKMKNVAARVVSERDRGNQVVVVVSAMGDLTDELIALAHEVGSNLPDREMDMLLTTGEQQSASLLAITLCNMGCPAVSLTGWQCGIMTDSIHCRARIAGIKPDRITEELEQGKVVVVAGYQGISPQGT